MELSSIKEYFVNLSPDIQSNLLLDLQNLQDTSNYRLLERHVEQLDNKQGTCPHCSSLHYRKNGKDKKVQKYKCTHCNRSFTAFTGTWLAHIHKKHLLLPYLKLMKQGLSLDKIKKELSINKKTAFDWRHKINASIANIEKESFNGITESDETFFLHSEKGLKQTERKARKRGKSVKQKGISNKQVAVIVSADRKNTKDFKVACLGRITKDNISQAIGNMIEDRTVLCTDGHVSYKGFALDNSLEHHVLRGNLKQYVKQKKYHIQHVNSMHSRMKGWIDNQLLGVASRYLQNYMNWFYIKEKFTESEFIEKIIELSVTNTKAIKEYRRIDENYDKLMQFA